MSLRPVFYAQQARQPAWVYDPEGGCGDTYQRVFDLNLDQRTMTDLGLQGNPAMLPAGSAKPITGQAGKSFHVTSSDPATVTISAHACSQHYFEWGLQVTYLLDGQTHVAQIGSAAAPIPLDRDTPQRRYRVHHQHE